MGAVRGAFKFSIGDKLSTYCRNMIIIDREYRQKNKIKNGKQFIANEKYYLYRCLDCGNEDWVVEYSIDEKQHCGCNACCVPPKKIVAGINDITTTAPWMVKYFKGGADEASKYSKYSKDKVEFVCPDCGRMYIKQICNVMTNGCLSCICSDNISYPNKFMYSILGALKIDFETEKKFKWSSNRRYDFYIPKYNTIIEMHGIQHYEKPVSRHTRMLEEEVYNDEFKKKVAIDNGIYNYFSIDCRKSNCEYIKKSIVSSGLLDVLNLECDGIDWVACDCFATSNFVKTICTYKKNNPSVTLHEIAETFKIAYLTVLRYVKIGSKFDWCNYAVNDDLHILLNEGKLQRGQKPVYCEDIDIYFRTANLAAEYLSTDDKTFHSRQIRQAISRNQKYLGYNFSFITQTQFNNKKLVSPSQTVGDFFYITT